MTGRELVYLDWNATTPPHPDVLAAMQRVEAEAWGNPASIHGAGQRARAELDAAREAVAALCDRDARDVVLTSGGTEANNLALHAGVKGGGALVLSRLEHPSIVRAAEGLAGVELRWIEVSESGQIDLGLLDRALEVGKTALVCLQAVNHETGAIQPVAEAAERAHRAGALFLCDAVQAAGKLAAELWQGADLVTIAAHKLRGPKGIGALCGRPGLKIEPLLRGGAQERGLRPGTQSPALAAGLAAAARRAPELAKRYRGLAVLRDHLEAELCSAGAVVNGAGPRAPHVSNLSFPGWSGAELCAALDLEGVAVSSGAACAAGTAEPSPVITAMVGAERARSAVRVSLGETTSGGEIEAALLAFSRVAAR